MWKVLDDERFGGAAAATVRLRSPRAAWTVESYEHGVETIELLCQQSSGVADILIPGKSPGPAYERLLTNSTLDIAVGPYASALAPGLRGNPYRRLPALLTVPARSDGSKAIVDQVLPASEDPWHLAYLTTFGSLGHDFKAELRSEFQLREDLAFGEFIEFTVTPPEPSVTDLLARLRRNDVIPPAGVSLSRFTTRPARGGQSALDGWLADREALSRRGGRVVVLYTPGDVGDLCLVWNLRARHGWMRGLPVAVPFTGEGRTRDQPRTDVAALARGTGLRIEGWPVQLVSGSVERSHLEALAADLRSSGQRADVVDVEDVLLPAAPPVRTSRAPVVFSGGRAMVAVQTDRDRSDLDALSRFRGGVRPELEATVGLEDDELAPSAVLRRNDWTSPRFTDGGVSVRAESDELQPIQWPTGWERFAAVCADRGVSVAPSASGRTALALLRQLGNLNEARWLAYTPLIELLYTKAASSGMAWWKKRSTEMAEKVAEKAEAPEAALAAIADAVAEVSVSLNEDSAGTLHFSEIVEALKARSDKGTDAKEAARAWLAWAESRRLLIRGTTIECPDCQHKQWRLVGELAPPLTCPGCLRPQERPYNESTLNFGFRLGEPLRRAIENDSVYHLLVARYLMVVMQNSPIPLVGVHPGVDFIRDGQQAEADVVILLANGEVVPVEVKTRSAGFKTHDVEMLDRLVTWFDGRASIAAAGDADANIVADFAALARDYPPPVRRLLTSQDWLCQYPVVSFGTGYPGPAIEGEQPTAADLAVALTVAPGPARKVPEELDAEFVKEVLRLRPDRPTSPRIAEKIDQYATNG